MFDDNAAGSFDEMTAGATQASAAFLKLQQDVNKLSGALSQTEDGAQKVEALAAAVSALQSILSLASDAAQMFGGSSTSAAGSVESLNASGTSLVGVLQQIASAIQASGLGTLAANADQTAKAFANQKQAMTDSSSGLLGLIANTVLYISLAAAVYDTLRVIDGVLGGQNLQWSHLGEAVGAAGQRITAAGGGLQGLSAILSGLVGRLTGVTAAAGASTAGMTTLAAASKLAGVGMRSLISLTGQVVTGLVRMVNQAIASKTAMTVATTAGSLLGKSFKALILSGAGFGYALSGVMGLLKSLPRLLLLGAASVQAFIVAAWPVLVPLLAIAAAVLAVIAAWKTFKAMLNIGGTVLSALATGLWEASKAAYALAKELGGYLYEGLKLTYQAIRWVVTALLDLYRAARDALIGALDRLAAALYVVIPALESMSDAFKSAAEKTGAFFDRMRNDSALLANTLMRLKLVFGENAAAAEEWAQRYASSTGRSFTDTARQVLALAREYEKLRVSADAARALSQATIQLGNDIASKLGVSPVGVMEALKSAIGGNTDALYAYGIAVDKAAVAQKLLEYGLSEQGASAGQKALAIMAVAADKAAFAWDHLRDNTDKYENQQQTLNAELKATSELLGGMLTQSHSRLMEMMIGGLRVLQRWISAHESFVRRFVDLPEILNAAAIGFKVLAVGASLLAGAILAVSSVLSILLSPLGMISSEFVRQSGILQLLGGLYENAFGGAIKRLVDTAMAARVAGVTIANWFTIGFTTAKAVAYDAIGAILRRFMTFLDNLPGLIRAFGGMEAFGSTIGKSLQIGFLTAKAGLLDFAAVAETVMQPIVDGAITFAGMIVRAAAHLEKSVYTAKALKQYMSGQLDVAARTMSFGDLIDPNERAKAIEDLRAPAARLFNPDQLKKDAQSAREELEKVRSDKAAGSPLLDAVAAAAQAANGAIRGTLDSAAAGMEESAKALYAETAKLRDPNNPTNLSGGIELDKEAQALLEQIQQAAKNSPLLEGFKNLFGEVIPQVQDAMQPRASAQGSFGGQLQTQTIEIGRQQLSYTKQIADNTKALSGNTLAVAGR